MHKNKAARAKERKKQKPERRKEEKKKRRKEEKKKRRKERANCEKEKCKRLQLCRVPYACCPAETILY
jgi:hypothetical protein